MIWAREQPVALLHRYVTVYYGDMYPVIGDAIRRRWNHVWSQTGQKLMEIRATTGLWKSEGSLGRKEEVVLNRLRAGHTLLTHGYLMDNTVFDIAPVCELCNEASLSIKHVFLFCTTIDVDTRNNFSIPISRETM